MFLNIQVTAAIILITQSKLFMGSLLSNPFHNYHQFSVLRLRLISLLFVIVELFHYLPCYLPIFKNVNKNMKVLVHLIVNFEIEPELLILN